LLINNIMRKKRDRSLERPWKEKVRRKKQWTLKREEISIISLVWSWRTHLAPSDFSIGMLNLGLILTWWVELSWSLIVEILKLSEPLTNEISLGTDGDTLTVHHEHKYNKPFREYGQLCKLDQAKGLDVGTVYHGQNGSIWSLFSDFFCRTSEILSWSSLQSWPYSLKGLLYLAMQWAFLNLRLSWPISLVWSWRTHLAPSDFSIGMLNLGLILTWSEQFIMVKMVPSDLSFQIFFVGPVKFCSDQ
jgi:hypothetical protein